MLADEVVDCHVLVIGSGGAGVRAAIEASQYGDTVLISKTIVGKGGCTPMAEGGTTRSCGNRTRAVSITRTR